MIVYIFQPYSKWKTQADNDSLYNTHLSLQHLYLWQGIQVGSRRWAILSVMKERNEEKARFSTISWDQETSSLREQ